MDSKEYWGKGAVNFKRLAADEKYLPIRCMCGKCFVDENAWRQHMRRLGKRGHSIVNVDYVEAPPEFTGY